MATGSLTNHCDKGASSPSLPGIADELLDCSDQPNMKVLIVAFSYFSSKIILLFLLPVSWNDLSRSQTVLGEEAQVAQRQALEQWFSTCG